MRGAFLVVIVITMLIVCFLVMKNIDSGTEEGQGQIETIQKAEETAKETEDALKKKLQELNR